MQELLFYYIILQIEFSFEQLQNYWFKEIEENSLSDAILVIVGNKSDLYENEQVSDKEGQKFADEKNAIFKRTSALSNRNIDSLFKDIAKKYFDPKYDYQAEDRKIKEKFFEKKFNQSINEDKINLTMSENSNSNCC
jgi:GTPase SAR1 family protein